MKKIILIIVMALGISAVSLAQDDDAGQKGNGSRIEALKIAYLTKKLNLSTEEAQKFCPQIVHFSFNTQVQNPAPPQKKFKKTLCSELQLLL